MNHHFSMKKWGITAKIFQVANSLFPQIIRPILKKFLALTMHSVWKVPCARVLEAWQAPFLGFL